MRVRLEADGEGGHSSIPPHDQAVTRLASALVNLQRYPQPSMFGEGTEADLLTLMAHKVDILTSCNKANRSPADPDSVGNIHHTQM